MNRTRAVIHVDMDAFYASVVQRDRPELRGRPVAVGGGSHRGVVAAASYEARRFGVRSAMPGHRARKLCPEIVFVKPQMNRFREVSSQIFAIFSEFTGLVEGLSLDEAFLDVSETCTRPGDIQETGRLIKQRIAEETGLRASVGMSHNKLLAKLASDYDKPDGFVYVAPGDVQRFMDPLPVRRLWGVGEQTGKKLRSAGILTIGQLRKASSSWVIQALGDRGLELQQIASGLDQRPVKTERVSRSISQETTFDRDHTSIDTLFPVIRNQAEKVAARLQKKGYRARTVTLKLRSGTFSTLTRSQTVQVPIDSADAIAEVAGELLGHWAQFRTSFSIRLLGVGVSGFGHD